VASNRIVLATIGAAHGVKGEVRVKPFTADPMALAAYSRLAAEDGQSLEIERLRPAKAMLVVKFKGIDNRGAAERLNGMMLHTDRANLPPPAEDEFYHADLIGLEAVTEGGEPLGAVIGVHDFGAGNILEIAPSRGKSMMMPFTKAVVPIVDIAGGRLVVVPPKETGDETDAQMENEGP
jgi:16S rRNA processing protein RimM